MKIKCYVLLILILIPVFFGCSQKTEAAEDSLVLRLENTVDNQLVSLAVTWLASDDAFHTTGMEIAGGGYLKKEAYSFSLTKADCANGTFPENLTAKVMVTDGDGNTYCAGEVIVNASWGTLQTFRLQYRDGAYSLWQVF